MVRCNQYSVPARFIGHRVRVRLSASAVTVYDRTTMVARHQRAAGKGVKVLDLDHYLEILARKPGALPGATALAQARAAGTFTTDHEAFWAAARRALGDGPGTRALVEVLLLHRHLGHAAVLAGLSAALAVGSVSPDVVAVEARKAAQRHGINPPPVPAGTTANPHAAGCSASWLPWRLAPQATGSILDRDAVPVAAVGVLVVGGLVLADRAIPLLVIDGRYTVPGAICADDLRRPDQSRPDQPFCATEGSVDYAWDVDHIGGS